MKFGKKLDILFHAGELKIKPISEQDLEKTLGVYKQVEEFLSLGPVPKATMKMVLADIQHSQEDNGIFCGIWNMLGDQIGVLDFIPGNGNVAILSLLMIGKPYQKYGYGRIIMKNLEEYLKKTYGTERIQSGVQVNNEAGIIFWKKMGFQIDNKPRDIGDGTTAFEMSKDL